MRIIQRYTPYNFLKLSVLQAQRDPHFTLQYTLDKQNGHSPQEAIFVY